MDVNRARQLVAEGATRQQIIRLHKAGTLARVRHGAYAAELADEAAAHHRQLLAATWPLLSEHAVLSHASAGLLHGLPLWNSMLATVSVTRASGGHGRFTENLAVRLAPLDPVEIVEVEGYRVTGLERTAVDLARILSYERAVCVLDAALHLKADADVLAAMAMAAQHRRGAGIARAALAFADGRSESVGESLSRVRLAALRLPLPELQANVFDALGRWVARTDFCWELAGVLGEFDGKLKYRGTSEQVADAVMREKRREARLRELGWVVVRWDWSDLADRPALRRRILAAFAQAKPDAIRGHVEFS